MHYQPKLLQSNYHQYVVRKVYFSVSLRSSLSLQPVRALQTSVDTGETFMSCKTGWSKDDLKSMQVQNLSEKAHEVHPHYSSQEYSNDESKEEQRRRKIGLANKGRVPWNKGKKHSAETRLRIKERTLEALRDPKVRKKMIGNPRTHSEQSKEKIGSSLRCLWSKRLKWKRLGERFFLSWSESIAEAARKGGSDQPELEWDSYDKIKQEIALEQLRCAEEKAKGKEMAKIRKNKSIKSNVSIQEDRVHIPALEKLNIELIKKEKMQNEVSLAEQIKAAKRRRAESISTKVLTVSSSVLSCGARLD
ncbi:hypothetical protein COLO4_17596 [Corchorus olitorius]|uniref:Nuclease associated modular domain-containing protein n=1 Tax=Corchorus olitorius TaxID=93759 RepID=A0A1R3JC54_9ROSI|nr:hypothetical protein COLO4_17596 [Corchorus olitorius]